MMAVPSAAMPSTAVPSVSAAPPAPVPPAIIPAVVPMPPPRPIVASPAIAVVTRVVAVGRVARITVIVVVPRIIAAAKRENHLSRSRARRGKENEARSKQTNERFHAFNLRPASEPRIPFL